jgi:signal peptidase I
MIEEAAAPSARLKPWLSALYRPRDTIRQTAGSTSAPMFLALCAVIGTSQVLSALTGPIKDLRDWQQIVPLVLTAAVMSLIGLFVTAAIARFAGRLMGGISSGAQVRAALAWGAVPLAWATAVSVLLLIPQGQTGSAILLHAAAVLLGVAAIWSFVVTVAMLMEVQKLSALRAFLCYSGATLFLMVAIASPIRIFLWQPFNIPSGGSIPTLIIGDNFFASKYAYGYSRYSFPFGLNLFSGRIFYSQPERGDVVVFKTPADNSTDFVKRLVGLPGDRIQMIAGVLNINGEPVKRERAGDQLEQTKCGVQPVHVYRETLPGGRSYLTQKLSETCKFYLFAAKDDTEVFVVPARAYFMIGDNRDDSADSRFRLGEGVGYVPEDNLVGRAEIIFLSVSKEGDSRAGRLLTRVR